MDLEFLERTAAEADVQRPGQGGRVAAALALLAGHRFFETEPEAVRGYPTLESYVAAGRELTAYYGSRERADFIQPLDAPPVVGGPVSVDWFRRRVPTPEGRTALGWLAFCEWILRTSELRPDHPGEFYSRIDGRTYVLRFRREDGVTPALVWAEPLG